MRVIDRAITVAGLVLIIISPILCSTDSPLPGCDKKQPCVGQLVCEYMNKRGVLKSFILTAETTYPDPMVTLANGSKISSKEIAPVIEEMRTDGQRFYICKKEPTTLVAPLKSASGDSVGPNDYRSRTWLWDGHFYYFYGSKSKRYATQYAQASVAPSLREKFIRMAVSSVTIYTNVDDPRTREWIDNHRTRSVFSPDFCALVKIGDDISIRETKETVNGSACYVVEIGRGSSTYTVWIDPAHGYNIVRAIYKKHGKVTFKKWDVKFKLFGDVWAPAEYDYQHFDSRGLFSEDRHHYKVIKLVLNPDHDALKSFDPNLPEGSLVCISGRDDINERREFTLKHGKVLDNEDNTVLTIP